MRPRTVASPLVVLAIVPALVLGAAGCGARTARPEHAPRTPARERSVSFNRSAYFIDRDEVAAAAARNAEDLLQRLRPRMLLPRAVHGSGTAASATPVVYVDDVREGGVDVLRLVPAHTIVSVTYLPAVEADRLLFGRHPAGAIVIRTRAGRPHRGPRAAPRYPQSLMVSAVEGIVSS